ncbi:unnamed protein product [Linum tenue]|uniref:Uncharacterized protein n=1 Tax=Linum tenue TaxID=586396 RepID=A0AAV0NQW8_9ROSI|nr:unnamed protein product [Linum tenue]
MRRPSRLQASFSSSINLRQQEWPRYRLGILLSSNQSPMSVKGWRLANYADMKDYGFEYSDEEPEEQDVDIENQYYNSKCESPSYAALEERLVKGHGEALKVLSALEAVTGKLLKFLVDQSVIPMFEKIVTLTMQVPLLYPGDIIGVNETHIAYIRRVSGSVLTIQESKGFLIRS